MVDTSDKISSSVSKLGAGQSPAVKIVLIVIVVFAFLVCVTGYINYARGHPISMALLYTGMPELIEGLGSALFLLVQGLLSSSTTD